MAFIVLISVTIGFAILGGISRLSQENNKKNEIKLSIFFLLVGVGIIIIAILFDISCYYDYTTDPTLQINKDFPILVFANIIFLSLAILFIMSYFNFRLKYDKNGFTYKNFLGIKKSYKYSDIEWFTYNTSYFGNNGIPLNKFESETKSEKNYRSAMSFPCLEIYFDGKNVKYMFCSGMSGFVKYLKENRSND